MGGGGGWGAVGGVKHPFGLKGQCCAFSKCHELIQSTREAQTAVRSSLVPHAVLLTHPRTMKCTLVVSQHRQKAVCKSRPGNLLSSGWCFWIVHECAYHVQAKDWISVVVSKWSVFQNAVTYELEHIRIIQDLLIPVWQNQLKIITMKCYRDNMHACYWRHACQCCNWIIITDWITHCPR